MTTIQRIETVKPGDHKKAKEKFTKVVVAAIRKGKMKVILRHPNKTVFGQMHEHMKQIGLSLKGGLDGNQAALIDAFDNLGDEKGLYDLTTMVARTLPLYQQEEVKKKTRSIDVLGDEESLDRLPMNESPDRNNTVRSSSPTPREEGDAMRSRYSQVRTIEASVKRALFKGLTNLTPGSPEREGSEEVANQTVDAILYSDTIKLDKNKLSQDVIDVCLKARRAILHLKDMQKAATKSDSSEEETETKSEMVNLPMDDEDIDSDDSDEDDEDLSFEPQKDNVQEIQEEKNLESEECEHCELATSWKYYLNVMTTCSALGDLSRQKEAWYNLQVVMKSLRVHTDDAQSGENRVSLPVSTCVMLEAMVTGKREEIPIMNHSLFFGNDDPSIFVIKHGVRLFNLYRKTVQEKVGNATTMIDKLSKIAMKFTKNVLYFFSEIIKEFFNAKDYATISSKLNAQGSNWYTTLRQVNKKESVDNTLERHLKTDVTEYIKYDKHPSIMADCPFTKNGQVLSLIDLLEHLADVNNRAVNKVLMEKWGCNLAEARWSYIRHWQRKLGQRKIVHVDGEKVPMTFMTKRILAKRVETNKNLTTLDVETITSPCAYNDVMHINRYMVAKLFEVGDKRNIIKLFEEELSKPLDDISKLSEEKPYIDYEMYHPLSVKKGEVSVQLTPFIDFNRLKKSKKLKALSEKETEEELKKFGQMIKHSYLRRPVPQKQKPVRMPLNVNSTTVSEGVTNYEALMHAIFATSVTEESPDKLNVKCIELHRVPSVNVMDLIRSGLEHSKKSHVAANFKKLNETNKSKMCVRLMKKTLQQVSEMMNESHSQINSTNAKTSAKTSSKKKDEKREYKYVLAKDSKLDARGKSEREWRDWVSDIQCVKCNKYGHYSPDCPEQ